MTTLYVLIFSFSTSTMPSFFGFYEFLQIIFILSPLLHTASVHSKLLYHSFLWWCFSCQNNFKLKWYRVWFPSPATRISSSRFCVGHFLVNQDWVRFNFIVTVSNRSSVFCYSRTNCSHHLSSFSTTIPMHTISTFYDENCQSYSDNSDFQFVVNLDFGPMKVRFCMWP